MKKRLLSALLALCMMLTMMPTVAFAAEDGETTADPPASSGGDVAYVIDDDTITRYATLDEAVNEAKEGSTIELLQNCELTKGFNKTLTFTGNGKITINKQLTSNGEGWMCFGLYDPTRVLTFDGEGVEVEWNSDGSAPWLMLSLTGTLNVTNGAKLTFQFDSRTTGTRNAIYMNNESEINVTNGGTMQILGVGTEGNAGQGIQLDEDAQAKVNVTGNSTFLIDGTNRGYVNSPEIYVEDSTFTVQNCTSNASNGGKFTAVNSTITYENNQGHGLSAGNVTIENSTLNCNNNAYYGLTYSGNMSMDGTSKINANGNGYGYTGGGLRAYGTSDVESGAEINILNNKRNGMENYGNFNMAEGVKFTVTGNNEPSTNGGGIYNGGTLTIPGGSVIKNNFAEQTGGGICNAGTVTISTGVDIYNNHADTAGDDIFNRDGATITFPAVGDGWQLDGDPDCTDDIDGWYDDSEGTRWEAHTAPIHTDEFANFTNGLATVKGLTALKAAHEAKALDPDDPNVPETPVSKSKTATNLDENYESEVTLSLPAADEQLVSDVVFVLDKSTSTTVEAKMLQMLENLKNQVAATDAKVKVGVVIFNKKANQVLELTELNDGNMNDIEAAIKKEISSGTNTHAGLLAGKAMLDADTEVAANRKYMVFVSDGITYMYGEQPQIVPYYWLNDGSPYFSADPYSWQFKYGNNNPPSDWNDLLTEIGASLEKETIASVSYDTKDSLTMADGMPVPTEGNYTTSVDRALYYTYSAYSDMQAQGYHCYAMTAKTGAEYAWGPAFMDHLSGGDTVDFGEIQNDIYYLLDEGSRVEDYMGYVAGEDGYNFDFVNDASALSMKVGEQTYAAKSLGNNQYGFALNEQTGGYDYILTYDAGNKQDTEHFVWGINVPVSQFEPVQLTYKVALMDPVEDGMVHGQYDADGSNNDGSGNYGLYTNNSATLYPVDSNGAHGVPENFGKPTVSYTVGADEAILIEPADITIYTGGEDYSGIVDAAGDPIESTETTTGLPEPGYHFTLPQNVIDWLQAKTGNTTSAQNLGEYLTFQYDVTDKTDNHVTRNWGIEYVGVYATDDEGNPTQYVYRMLPGETGVEGQNPIPVRLVYFDDRDENGTYNETEVIDTDDITMGVDLVSDTYKMTINPGELDQNQIKAVLQVGSEAISCDVRIGTGDLLVKSTTNAESTNTVKASQNEVTGDVITAVDNGEVTYYVNESEVTLKGDRVRLLVDEVSNSTEFDAEMGSDAMNRVQETSDMYNLSYDTAYMDLVDTQNGNAVLTMDEGDELTIYWPAPSNAASDSEYRIVHYTDMDRVNVTGAEDLDTAPAEVKKGELVHLNGNDYVEFTVKSFSPFVLVWEANDNGGSSGGSNNKPDDLNTEDHFAYIIGYPKDYRTGEPTDDESLWPVEPQGNITRAEVATIFFRMLTDDARSENWSQTNSYTDVASTDWYNNAISTLSNMGIISGDPSGAFRPDDSITRAEFTKIAVGFFDKAGDYVDGTYDDVSSSDWYADFIDAAVDLGLIEGYPDGTIRPEATITRAEACTIVNRTLGRVPDKDHLLPADEMRVWPDNSDTDEWYYAQIQEATNSHDYEWIGEENDQIENWTEKLEDRDWAQLEREWSDANSAPGGEVVD